MKLFKVIVDRPYIYARNSLGETPCVAQVKFLEAFVSAESVEEADKKIRAKLPTKDPGEKYYNIQIKEIEGKDGVYFC